MSPAESTPQSKSTGPRTPEGKAIASHNALRHGLTGRVVVLPTEDMNQYRAFCKELMDEFAPATALERQHGQTFCDIQWRLNRARSYEDSMLALGHFEDENSVGTDDPQILAALSAGKVFRENSKAFVNLSLYEQRLARQQKEALRQLRELQAERRTAGQAAKQTAEAEPAPASNPNKTNEPATPEFVFSTAEIERESTRPGPRPEARNVRANDYNLPEAA